MAGPHNISLRRFNIKWSEAPLSAAGVYQLFRDELPVFAKVENGFYGVSSDETFASEEELCISAVGHQQRVFCHDPQNHRHLSLPLNLEVRVKPTNSVSGSSYTLKEVVDKFNFPIGVTILPAEHDNIIVGGRNMTYGRAGLTLLRCFDEPLLLAHNLYTYGDIRGGGINRRFAPILLHSKINMVFSRLSDVDKAVNIQDRLSTALQGVNYSELEQFGYFVVYPGNEHPPMETYGPNLEGSFCEIFQRPSSSRQSNQYVSLADPRNRVQTLEELTQLFSSVSYLSSNPLLRQHVLRPTRPNGQPDRLHLAGNSDQQQFQNELSKWLAKTVADRKALEYNSKQVAEIDVNRGDSGFYEDRIPESHLPSSQPTVPDPFSAPVSHSKSRLVPVPLTTQVSSPGTLGLKTNPHVRFDSKHTHTPSGFKQCQNAEIKRPEGKLDFRIVSPFLNRENDIPQRQVRVYPTPATSGSLPNQINSSKPKHNKVLAAQSRAVFNPSNNPKQRGAWDPERNNGPSVASRLLKKPPPQAESRSGYKPPQSSGTDLSSHERDMNVSVGGSQSLAQVPTDLRKLGVKQVVECLKLLGLTEYCTAFEKEHVDGELLTEMMDETNGEAMFIDIFKLKEFHARKLSRFVHGWRPKV